MLQRLAGVLDVTFVSKLLHPGHPFLHHLLHFFRRSPALGTAIKIYKLAHSKSSLVCFLILERLRRTATDNFFRCFSICREPVATASALARAAGNFGHYVRYA